MAITSNKYGVWILDDIYKKVSNNCYGYASGQSEPGSLFAWGLNVYGRVGDNTAIGRSSPMQIPGSTWTQIATKVHSMSIKCDGTLWAWGCGVGGSLGNSNTITRSSPVQIPGTAWCKISVACGSSFALKTDGTLWSWGCNIYGELGTNNATFRSSPVQIPGTQWSQVNAGGNNNFVLAIKTDGTLWAWGYNGDGNLGTNNINIIYYSSPTQIPGTSWRAGYVAHRHSFATKTDNTLWAMGWNFTGQLGDGTQVTRSSPVQVPGTQWNQAAGSGVASTGTNNSYATKTDGTLWGWGTLPVGDNTSSLTYYISPVQIPGNSWCCVTADYNTAAFALKTDNTLWVWGNQSSGNLGVSNTNNYSSPVQIPGTWYDVCSTTETCGAIARRITG